MIHFTPTLGIKDTGKNVRTFIKENINTFWDVFKPYMPYVVVLTVIDLLVTNFLMPIDGDTGEPYEFALGGLIVSYFYTCLAITWHRVVIHGPDNFEAMNPFKPKRSELAFVGMGIALFMMIFAIGSVLGLTAFFVSHFILFLILPAIIFAAFLWIRVVFYFPAKATGRHISFKQSYGMTKGYVWKMIAGYIVAAIKLILVMFLALFVIGFIGGVIAYTVGSESLIARIVSTIVDGAIMMPLALFFQPMFAVIWVTVLSNYYQYVMQNDAPPVEEDKAVE